MSISVTLKMLSHLEPFLHLGKNSTSKPRLCYEKDDVFAMIVTPKHETERKCCKLNCDTSLVITIAISIFTIYNLILITDNSAHWTMCTHLQCILLHLSANHKDRHYLKTIRCSKAIDILCFRFPVVAQQTLSRFYHL